MIILKNNMVFKVTFSEVEIASDVKSFISFNSDSYETESLKEEILSSQDDDLLKITKTIASQIKIIKVEEITDELLERAL